jgi:4-carboxymuconolactone decarboxylase
MPLSGHDIDASRPTRIPVLEVADRSDRQQRIVDDLVAGPTTNIYITIVRHPEAAAAMVNLGRTLRAGVVPARDREIVILRTGWNCGSPYELAQHLRIGRTVGLTDEDVARIRSGPDAPGWDPFESALCRACDELHSAHTVSDPTWAVLDGRYDEQQLIQVTMLIGYYHLVSFVLNALGVPIEAGAERFPSG